jgi:hypothetical protein
MVDAGIGRLLIASLHQGIAEVSPTRLDFYEEWLSPTGLRDGRMGLAPLGAVLSFLQREAAPANHDIPIRAGTCAAAWVHDGYSPTRKALAGRLPAVWRARSALAMGRTVMVESMGASRVRTRLRRGHAAIEIRSALFDYLREPAAVPMRRFCGAAYAESLRLYGLDGTVDVDDAGPACRLAITVGGSRPVSAAVLDLR